MSAFRKDVVKTRSGSAIVLHECGDGAFHVFAVGGMAVRPFAQSAIAPALQDAADKGARCTIMDIAGSGESKPPAALTMETWLEDLEEIFADRAGVPALWTGASIGAWLMVLAHRRHPDWFRAMCALAPAFDWDQQYVGPRLKDGRLGVIEGTVVNPDGTSVATRELLVSMAPYHLLRAPAHLTAPMHVIFGARDELAPAEGTRRFVESCQGARCTGEMLPDGDHGVAKLDPPLVMLRYQSWLRGWLAMSKVAR
jgi:pimeloyl-ACP methyl ester carboxylesterase